jgi:hypothetical protein
VSIAGAILKAVLDSLLGKLESIFPWLRNWLDRPVIVPGRQRNWWHMGRTGDYGLITTAPGTRGSGSAPDASPPPRPR